MAGAELPFLVLFVASALLGLARLDFRRGCGVFCHGVLSTNRGHGKMFSMRCARYAALRRYLLKTRIAGKHPQCVPNRPHNDTTTACRSAAYGRRRRISFA